MHIIGKENFYSNRILKKFNIDDTLCTVLFIMCKIP